MVTDGRGLPLAVHATAWQVHEVTQAREVLTAIRIKHPGPGRPRTRPKRVAGDKGYSAGHLREWLRSRGIQAVIPRKSNERRTRFDKDRYRQRCVIEQCVGWLKESLALATRYDKTALNFLATAKLAMMKRCFRKLDSSDRA